MFDLEHAIDRWLKTFRKYKAFDHGNIREMELHLRDHIDDLVAKGHTQENAFNQAVSSFGDIYPMAKEEYLNIKIGATTQSIFIAMILNYLKVAIRSFSKQKFYALINITGLTIGLSIVFLIGLFVSDELSFDRFHEKKDRLFRVVENQYYAGQPVFPVAVTPTALGPSLLNEYPEVVNFTRVSPQSIQFSHEGTKISENNGVMVDQGFFDMFSFPVIQGTVTDFKSTLNGLVLNEEMAEKYFGDNDPIGSLVKLNDEEYEVKAVIKNFPENSHLNYRYIVNFENYLSQDADRANTWGSNWLYTYVELVAGTDLIDFNKKIVNQIKNNNESSVTDIYLQPLTDIYLGAVDFTVDVSRKGEMLYVRIFSIVAIFILMISCINFMNLSTARSAKRIKEVGLRKTVGSSRSQLVFQFLSESMLLTTVAVILSLILVTVLLPYFNQIANKSFNIQMLIDPSKGFKIAAGIILAAIFTGLFSGSYPAIILSGIKPALTLKTQSFTLKSGAGLRKVLVITQFVISIVLIIGTLVVYKQFQHIQNINLGYNKDHIIYTFVPGDKSQTFANELKNQKGIVNVGFSNRHPAYVLSSSSDFSWPGKNEEDVILIHYMGIDENYVETMGMSILEGRNFAPTDSAVVMINQRAKEMMGIENPVGQVVTSDRDYKIVALLEDFNFKSVHTSIEPIVVIYMNNLERAFIKYEANQEADISATIKSVWDGLFPDAEYNIHFLDEDFNEMYMAEQRTSKLSSYFAILAIIISCLGLFGLVSYATEQRSKEIGIRKVMGASIYGLFLLLTKDFTKLVLLSLIIAVPIGWYTMEAWLENYAYRITIPFWIYFMAGILSIIIALITVSYHSLRASTSNPVKALRND